MQFGIFLVAAVGLLLQTTEAKKAQFKCNWGQFGECYYYQGNSKSTSRCAITCGLGWGKVYCNCPQNYPNKASWPLIKDQHDCIYQGQYERCNKCQDPADHKRGDDEPRYEARAVTGFDDDDLPRRLKERELTDLEERDLTDLETRRLLFPDDHDLPQPA